MDQPVRLFKDDKKERQLNEEGYVIMPFFDKNEVKTFLSFFQNEHKEESKRIYAISHSSDLELKNKVSNWIKENYAKRVKEHFHNVQIMGGTFISKPANGKGLITPHRDWNLVDESKYRSCNIWVPLVDTSIENGAIEILPKSHLLGPLYRGPNITNQLKNVEEFLWENMQIKPMKAGYAFVYDHRFIHGSKHNNTTKERPASACAITPKEAKFRFYHKHTTTKGERIEEFESYPEYLLREDRFDYPTVLKHLRTLDVNSNYFDENHFNILNLNSHTEKPNLQVQKEGFFQKLKSLLKA